MGKPTAISPDDDGLKVTGDFGLYGPSTREEADQPKHQENEEQNLRDTGRGAGDSK